MTALTIAACVVGYLVIGAGAVIVVERAAGIRFSWAERLSFAPFWLPFAAFALCQVIAEDFMEPRK